jgi:hypothetical protein
MVEFLIVFGALLVVGFPIHGAVMYGDPWTWWKKGSGHG